MNYLMIYMYDVFFLEYFCSIFVYNRNNVYKLKIYMKNI